MGIKISKANVNDGGAILKGNIHVTRRELDVLVLMGTGLSNEEAAKRLYVSVKTVRNHIWNVMQKMGARSRAHSITLAVQHGILMIEKDKSLVGWKGNDYALCLICGRASLINDFREVEPEITMINHVNYEIPQMPRCPYAGCKGNLGLSLHWEEVIEKRPDYEEIPVPNKVYDWDLDWVRGK